MATGKFRAAKRSSTGSYTSTVTTLVFVCICGLGLWMLTSNSYVSPNKSITRVSDEATSSQLHSRKIPIDSPVFEDNPGNLPEDAIQTDDTSAVRNNDLTVGSNQTKNTIDGNADEVRNREQAKQQTEMSGSEADKQPEVDEELIHKTEGKEMPLGSEVDKRPEVEEEPKTEDIGTAKDTGQQGKAVTEHETGTSGSEVDKSLHVSEVDEEPKIKTDEVQISEESTMTTTQNQRIEETSVAKNTTVDEDHQIRKTEHTEEDEEEEHHITEEEQENRMEKHQQQQEESQNEETSTDQTQHNEEKPREPHLETKTEAPTEDTTIIAPDKDSKAETTRGEGSSGIPKESHESKKGWETQAGQSKNQKERQERNNVAGLAPDHKWELCNVTTGTDYIPCLDNNDAIQKLASKSHLEHRERHCPEEGPMCLVPIPEGYNIPIPWPHSRDKIWLHNVPYKSLEDIKGHQNWVRVNGEFLTFPEGGIQSNNGAIHYIDVLQEAVPEIAWGKHTRVVLDVGCGVGSFGGYLFDKDVLAMSFGPNDEQEAQIQIALERGIPAISAVMGTRRLPFPSKVFDLIHCARCRVPLRDVHSNCRNVLGASHHHEG